MANVAGRAALVEGEHYFDVGEESGGAIPADPMATQTGVRLRLDAGTSHVKRLGHCVLEVLDFRASETWYKERLGLVTSDEIALDETTVIGAFLRCDQGDRYVDHHTLFLIGAGRAGFDHAAFEVADFDDLMRG
ncbi:MAG: hypothetical protein ACO4BZ_11010, partial [Ilumatobacteraceae bacterium]